MEYNEFKEIFLQRKNEIKIEIENKQIEKFYKYMDLLLQWNEKINLTAITDPTQIIEKHFIDSLSIKQYIKDDTNIIDVGTGAGFPGIPLAIVSNCNFTLVDSLNKRINFLNAVVKELDLNNVICVHSRAEDFAKTNRDKFDVAISRAVASMNILLEYLIPFIKVGGTCICMKGPKAEEEIKEASNALKILGGQIEEIKELKLGEEEYSRNIVIVKKIKSTPTKYPRKAGMPNKEPII